MTGSIRNFEKLNFTPKSSVFCFSQGQTSEYDRLAQLHAKLMWLPSLIYSQLLPAKLCLFVFDAIIAASHWQFINLCW